MSICFFFSSRRRHTRWPRDWSSDVCSSDLRAGLLGRHAERDAPASALLALVRLVRRSSPAAAGLTGLALTRGPVASGGREAVPPRGAYLASPSTGTRRHQPSASGRATHSCACP